MRHSYTSESAIEFFNRRRPSREERRATGESLRLRVPLEAHAELPSLTGRPDSLQILRGQESQRAPELLPLRYQRMSASPFAYLRGAAAVMARDLSESPHSGITVQLCGDAHLANFGMFASQERNLVFDLNDFDETLPGPFEWDVKRLAASFAVAARDNEFDETQVRAAAAMVAKSYRQWMAEFSQRNTLDVWFARVDVDWMLAQLGSSSIRKALVKASTKARKKTVDSAVLKLTEVVDSQRQFRTDPPLLTPIHGDEFTNVVHTLAPVYADYVSTLAPDRAALLARYSFTDFALKVVGVGSVGTRAYVLLLESGDGEPIILQGKQAGASVLEPYAGATEYANYGQRVVAGQRLMQSTGDPFLGWCHGTEQVPYDFYFRQLWDMKGSIDATLLDPHGLRVYARICGAVLARAHARAGDASLITGYLGEGKEFDTAIASYALGYADLTALDYAQLLQAELPTPSGETLGEPGAVKLNE
jgi:uncharacterized protein (DUF2252 family)